jgi:hypothetical protein
VDLIQVNLCSGAIGIATAFIKTTIVKLHHPSLPRTKIGAERETGTTGGAKILRQNPFF